MANQAHHDLLAFEPPSINPKGWETAEAQAFRFPQRYITKCQEFNDYARGLATLEKEKNQLFAFVVRNLIAAMDNLQSVVEQAEQDDEVSSIVPEDDGQPAVDEEADQPATENAASDEAEDAAAADEAGQEETDETPEAPDGSQADEETAAGSVEDDETSVTRRGEESVGRSVMNILEGLHIEPVSLLGKTYRGVEVNGRLVEDPFEIVEARSQGKASELPVQEVITSLWVQTEPGLRVIRKGQVIC